MDPFLDATEPLTPSDAVAALIVTPDGRYLLQKRDPLTWIFYPDHWGLFGGAIEPGESDMEALARELLEELGLAVAEARSFTRFDFDYAFAGRGICRRVFFEVNINAAVLDQLTLTEGVAMALWPADEALSSLRLTPYDAFALWLHSRRDRLSEGVDRGEI